MIVQAIAQSKWNKKGAFFRQYGHSDFTSELNKGDSTSELYNFMEHATESCTERSEMQTRRSQYESMELQLQN